MCNAVRALALYKAESVRPRGFNGTGDGGGRGREAEEACFKEEKEAGSKARESESRWVRTDRVHPVLPSSSSAN